MMQIFRNWRRKLGKPLLFGFYGAIGCLIASLLLGELFLSLTSLPPTPVRQPQAVVIVIDASGSMSEIVSGNVQPTGNTIKKDGKEYQEVTGGISKLDEVKASAIKFVKRQNLSIAETQKNQDQIAVIGFGTDVHITTPLTSNLTTIERAIASVNDEGGTRINLGLEAGIFC